MKERIRELLERIVESGEIHGEQVLAYEDYPRQWGDPPESLDKAHKLLIPWTVRGDYCGDLIYQSNRKVLLEEYGDSLPLVERGGMYGTEWLELDFLDIPEHDTNMEALESFVEAIEALSEYPLLDEEHHSLMVQEEVIPEEIESWALSDTVHEIGKALSYSERYPNGEVEVTELGTAVIRDALHRGTDTVMWEPDGPGIYIRVEELVEDWIETGMYFGDNWNDPRTDWLNPEMGVIAYLPDTEEVEPPAGEGAFLARVSFFNRQAALERGFPPA